MTIFCICFDSISSWGGNICLFARLNVYYAHKLLSFFPVGEKSCPLCLETEPMRLVSSKHVVSFYGGEAISLCKTEESHIHQQISFCLSTVESYGTCMLPGSWNWSTQNLICCLCLHLCWILNTMFRIWSFRSTVNSF